MCRSGIYTLEGRTRGHWLLYQALALAGVRWRSSDSGLWAPGPGPFLCRRPPRLTTAAASRAPTPRAGAPTARDVRAGAARARLGLHDSALVAAPAWKPAPGL